MPYSNVPEEKWDDMDSCVEKVMADGKTKEQAIAICYSSIVERQNIEEEAEDPIAEEKEVPISEDDLLPTEDEPVGLAAELGKEDAPVDQEIMDEAIEGEPEQEVAEGVEGPPADEATGIVKVEFIDDGDDFEMDAAIAGIGGDSPYPDMSGQEPPPYTPPKKGQPLPAGDGVEETPTEAGAWTPPNISVQELMDMEPAAMFYDGSVKDVVQSERELRAWRRKVNRMQKIADLRPRPELDKKETVVERAVGVFRRLIMRGGPGSGHHGHRGRPGEIGGSQPGTGVGVAERPAHVGASIKIKQLSNPRTTGHVNDGDPSQWQQIRDEETDWGTDKETGEMMEAGAWCIASQMLDNVEHELGGRPSVRERAEPDADLVQQAIDEMISADTENDHYEVEQALKNLYDRVEGETLGEHPTWVDIAEFIGKSEDEMQAMSDSDIDDEVTKTISLGVIDELEKAEKGEDVGLEDWQVNFALQEDSAASLREDIDNYSGDVVDYLQAQAYDAIETYQQDNPSDYNYDYLVDDLGIDPARFGVGESEEYYTEEGEIGLSNRTYYYSTDNETGEIVAVMQTNRAYEEISRSRLEAAAAEFGFDPDEVNPEMLVIDLLASKYPRQGYGTEMILNALRQAHEEDRGLGGSAVMAAAMFYDKLGAQYLSKMGQTEGGGAFWTNVQVHAAYEWLQEQMAGVESGEITAAEIGEEQKQAEAREDEPAAPSPSREPRELQGSIPETLREMDGTRWTTPAGVAHVAINYDAHRGEWSAHDLNEEGEELFNYDAEDASYFFERLANDGFTVPELASTPSPQHIAIAIEDGFLSIHVDEGPPAPSPPVTEQFQTTPGGVSLVNFGGGEQSRNMGIQNQAAANSRYLSFEHESGAGVPVIAMQVDRGGRTGPTVWEVVGSGQIYDNEDDLLEDTGNWDFVATGAGPVGSNTMGMLLEQMSGDEDVAQSFLYNMIMQSSRGEYLRLQQEREATVEASLRQDSLRRVERHYGPGPHPGTGTPQSVHGKGAGGKTRVGVTSAVEGKPSGQVFEEMRSFAGELNKITSIKNVSVTPGIGGWEGEREATWIVSYEGNGNAMRLIARTAKEKEQEAVIFAREGGDEPISTFAFSDRVTPDERGKVEDLLVEAGVGWSWLRLPGGQPTLMIMNVPQWGGKAEAHRMAMSKLTNMFDAIEMPHEFKEEIKKVDILEKEGPYGYDTILEAGS